MADSPYTYLSGPKTHLSEAKEAYIREGTKGLMIINGAGAIALLTFLQAIWEKTAIDDLRFYVLVGICFLVGGVSISSLIYLARHIAFVKNHSKSPQFWYATANRIMPVLSVLCFVVGIGMTVYGGFSAIATEIACATPQVNSVG